MILQGMDTSGKGGVIRHAIGMVDPQGVRIKAFKAPTEEEETSLLWRIERELPPPGVIGIFDRSHYEDVLVVRVRKLVEEAVWSAIRRDQRLGEGAPRFGHHLDQVLPPHLECGAEGPPAGSPRRSDEALEVPPGRH